MSAAAEHWVPLYAEAELEVEEPETGDDTAAPAQGSRLGARYYYLEDAPGFSEWA